MPRRFHRKSRFGCVECRKRKIKCDEVQPVCGRCSRTRTDCHYPSTSGTMSESPTSEPPKPGTPSIVHHCMTCATSSSFTLLDLSLMHHYATHTCLQIFKGEGQTQFWQIDVPSLAASSIVLMHGLLAVTAVQLAQQYQAWVDVYRARAIHHHAVSLPMFQELIASASAEKADVIVAYSILLSIWIYSYPGIANERQSLDDILAAMNVVRSARRIFRHFKQAILAGPLGSSLDDMAVSPTPRTQFSLDFPSLQSLQNHLRHPADRAALRMLRAFLDQYVPVLDHNRVAAHWVASVGDDFWVRLCDHHPDALLVFSYSTVLVTASENECWWVSGWSERILQACSNVLSPEQQKHIDWMNHEQKIQDLSNKIVNYTRSYESKFS